MSPWNTNTRVASSCGWTQEIGNLNCLLLYMDSLHLLVKANTKLVKFILTPIISPAFGNTVTNSVYADVVYFLFKDDHFHPLKHSSSVNVSEINNQSAVVHKVIIHKYLNTFVARKHVSVFCRSFIRPNFVSKPVCFVPSKQ